MCLKYQKQKYSLCRIAPIDVIYHWNIIYNNIIDVLICKKYFHIVVGQSGANFNYFICCWVV